MSRELSEWIGKDDNTAIPARVRLRVFLKFGGQCSVCGRKLVAGERWDCDHIFAIVLGGENRERNLRPLCEFCHGRKTADDVFVKAKVARVAKKHLGIKRSRSSFATNRDSIWKKKMSGEVVRR